MNYNQFEDIFKILRAITPRSQKVEEFVLNKLGNDNIKLKKLEKWLQENQYLNLNEDDIIQKLMEIKNEIDKLKKGEVKTDNKQKTNLEKEKERRIKNNLIKSK